MYGIFPPVFKKPMCLASGVVLCPVLLHKHPSLILLRGVGASPSRFPPPRSCSCSVPSSPLPSPGPGVCAPNPSLSTVSLCLSSPAFGAAVGFQPCLLWLCGVSLNTRLCFPFLPHLGACYFSGGSTAPLTLSLAAQRKSELCSVVEEHGMCPCYRRIRMQCLL